MRKFIFKFDPILRQRKFREEGALRQLGAAQCAYQAELATKGRFERQLQEALIRRESLGSKPVGITEFLIEQDFIIGTKQRMKHTDQAITRASRSVEKALRTYLLCRRQTRAMETLYEKYFAEFKKERARLEQKELEDLTIMRARFKEVA